MKKELYYERENEVSIIRFSIAEYLTFITEQERVM